MIHIAKVLSKKGVRLPGFEFEFQLYYSLAVYHSLSMPWFPHMAILCAMKINECVDVKIPGTVAGHGTVLYKLATYSMVLQQPWDYFYESVAGKSL